MHEGILDNPEEEHAEHVINNMYPSDVIPILTVLTGSRASGLNCPDSDRNYMGIHFMDTWDYLEHPDFRSKTTKTIIEIKDTITFDQAITLRSFEMQEFISLLYNNNHLHHVDAPFLLNLPPIHLDLASEEIFSLCRKEPTTVLVKNIFSMQSVYSGGTKHLHYNGWLTNKRLAQQYYQFLQALYFIQEKEFEWDAWVLAEYAKSQNVMSLSTEAFQASKDTVDREDLVREYMLERIVKEVQQVIKQIAQCLKTTSFPEEFNMDTLKRVLALTKNIRARLI